MAQSPQGCLHCVDPNQLATPQLQNEDAINNTWAKNSSRAGASAVEDASEEDALEEEVVFELVAGIVRTFSISACLLTVSSTRQSHGFQIYISMIIATFVFNATSSVEPHDHLHQ